MLFDDVLVTVQTRRGEPGLRSGGHYRVNRTALPMDRDVMIGETVYAEDRDGGKFLGLRPYSHPGGMRVVPCTVTHILDGRGEPMEADGPGATYVAFAPSQRTNDARLDP